MRGRYSGTQVRDLGLRERIRDLVTQPEWESSYQLWRDAAEQAVILNLLAKLPMDKVNPRAKFLRRTIAALALQYARKSLVLKIDQVLTGLIVAQVVEQVERLGLARHLSFLNHRGLSLIPDLTQLALWEAELEKLCFLQYHHRRYGVLSSVILSQLRYPLVKTYEHHSP
ncbi:MAG: hypothetical protein ACU4EQ_01840 [Candidatus Nitrosoglobus sp.]